MGEACDGERTGTEGIERGEWTCWGRGKDVAERQRDARRGVT